MEIIKTLRSAQPHQNEIAGRPGGRQSVSRYLSGSAECTAALAGRGRGEGQGVLALPHLFLI